MSGGSAGLGRRGGNAATDEQEDEIGGDYDFFRGTLSRHIWGIRSLQSRHAVTMGVLTGAGSGDRLRAYPQIFPRGGTIGRIGWFNNIAATGAEGFGVRFGIYSNSEDNRTAVPDSLLWDSGTQSSWPAGNGGANANSWRDVNAALPVEAGSVLWLAFFYNAALQNNAVGMQMSKYQGPESDCCALLGFTDPEIIVSGDGQYRMPSAQSNWYGYRVDQTFGALPSTFPSGATRYPIAGDAISSNPVNDPSGSWSGRIPLFLYEWSPEE